METQRFNILAVGTDTRHLLDTLRSDGLGMINTVHILEEAKSADEIVAYMRQSPTDALVLSPVLARSELLMQLRADFNHLAIITEIYLGKADLYRILRTRIAEGRDRLLNEVSYGDTTLNTGEKPFLKLNRRTIHISATEAKLLAFFMRNPEKEHTRSDLTKVLSETERSGQYIDAFVSRIERVLVGNNATVRIQKAHAVGYKLVNLTQSKKGAAA